MILQRWTTIIAITLLSLFALQYAGQDVSKAITLLVNTLLGCAIVTIGASFGQWCYTQINFTKSDVDKKTLGYIYVGCSLVYLGYLIGGYKTLFVE